MLFDLRGDVYVLELGERRARRLTSSRVYESDPSWSPDGREIVYVRGGNRRSLSGDVWAMTADGTGEHLVVEGGIQPDWQPVRADE